MSRNPNPMFAVTLEVHLIVGANSLEEVGYKLNDIVDFVGDRLERSTFKRLPGKPEVMEIDYPTPTLHGYEIDSGLSLDANGRVVGTRLPE